MTLKFSASPFHAIETSKIANNSVLKADLIIMIRDIIEQQGWTEKETLQRLEVSHNCLLNVVNGDINKLTLDVLFSMLDKLGFRSEFTFNNLEEAASSHILCL